MAILLFASCKQTPKETQGENVPKPEPQPQVEEVTISVSRDVNVKSITPDSFKLSKGTELTLAQALAKVTIVFKDGWTRDKVMIGGATGNEWVSGTKHKFEKDEILYILSKEAGEDVTVTVAGDDNVETVSPETFTLRKGTELTLEQALEKVTINYKGGYVLEKVLMGGVSGTQWLSGQEHKFDNDETLYIVSKQKFIDRKLKELTIAGETKKRDDIQPVMEFIVGNEVKEVEVKAKVEPEDSQIKFTPELKEGGKLDFKENEMKLKIVVGDNHNEYTAVLKRKGVESIPVSYTINGKGPDAYGVYFGYEIDKDKNPTAHLDSKKCNLKLTGTPKDDVKDVEINGTKLDGDKIVRNEQGWSCLHSIDVGTTATQITVVVNPTDTTKFVGKTIKFQAIGTQDLPKVDPKFEEISGEVNLPQKAFLDKLTNDSDHPEYQVEGNTAKVVISISAYENEQLCKEIKIDDETIELKPLNSWSGRIKAEKEIPVTSENKLVKVEFIPKDGNSSNLVWKFNLKTGGKKPTIPKKFVLFAVNHKGTPAYPWEAGFYDKLLEKESAPLITYDGNTAFCQVATYSTYQDLVDEVEFRLEDELKKKAPLKKDGAYLAEGLEWEFSDDQIYNASVTILPKDTTKYSSLTYYFKLQKSGRKHSAPLNFLIDGAHKNSGTKMTLENDFVEIAVQCEDKYVDNAIVEKVEIGLENQLVECEVKKLTNDSNVTYWHAKRELENLPNAQMSKVLIKVTLKDNDKYDREQTCMYELTANKVPEYNASFAIRNGRPIVYRTINWKAEFADNYMVDDYGAESVDFETLTVSHKAKVMYAFVDAVTNEILEGETPKEMTKKGNSHIAERIMLFTDKPSKIKAWVIAEDGISTDEKLGVWYRTLNPVPLCWSYHKKDNGAEYTTKTYNVIKINKNAVQADKKIHLLYYVWRQRDGYAVDSSDLPAEQEAFQSLGEIDYQEYFRTSVDVSALVSDPPTKDEVEAVIKLKKNNKLALTYKVKIKLDK